MKKWVAVLLAVCMLVQSTMVVSAEPEQKQEEIESPSVILMEASTGTILYEKDADNAKTPASVTKVMTLLLIFEAIEKGRIKMEDEVITSAHAKSMGGSQVFLEEGEKQSVETMIKCIVIASGNDAAVAMAEHIAGSEQEFVNQMNARAAELGMKNTHFVDCCGLTESTEHYTTARDIAIMTREITLRFPKVFEYATIWMENITHVTNKGSSEFGLTNTNKLLRSYEGCIGLKTGSTSIAKYCLSAVAKRNDITLISVIMMAPNSKVRFRDAATLFNLGFGKCKLYTDVRPERLPDMAIAGGVEESVPCRYEKEFRYLDTEGADLNSITSEIRMKEEVQAPVKAGDEAGKKVYFLGKKEIGSVKILFEKDVERAGYWDYVEKVIERFTLAG